MRLGCNRSKNDCTKSFFGTPKSCACKWGLSYQITGLTNYLNKSEQLGDLVWAIILFEGYLCEWIWLLFTLKLLTPSIKSHMWISLQLFQAHCFKYNYQSGIFLNLRTGPTGHATLFNQWEGALVFIKTQIKTSTCWSKIFTTADGVGQN